MRALSKVHPTMIKINKSKERQQRKYTNASFLPAEIIKQYGSLPVISWPLQPNKVSV
jgi:hypothetical protein